jgi:hypothetical protein
MSACSIKDKIEWDKLIVVAKSIDKYYRKIFDKRIYDCANVILMEEDKQYVLIKNIWKYGNNYRKCKNLLGEEFDIEDIKFMRIRPGDYRNVVNIKDELPKNIIIKCITI